MTETTSTRFRWAASDRYNLLKYFAKENRKNATLAEDILWENIRNKTLGAEFRRQHIIADFIADFVCLDKMLIIEILFQQLQHLSRFLFALNLQSGVIITVGIVT